MNKPTLFFGSFVLVAGAIIFTSQTALVGSTVLFFIGLATY